MITFDLFPTDKIYESMFKFSEIEPPEGGLNEQFSSLGYGCIFMICNMGSMYLFLLITPAYILILWLLLQIPPWFCGKFGKKKIIPDLRERYSSQFYNDNIDFVNQGYLVLTLMSMINLTDLRLSSDYSVSEIYNSLFALTWFIFALIFPFFIVAFYNYKIKLDKPLPNLRDNMTMS